MSLITGVSDDELNLFKKQYLSLPELFREIEEMQSEPLETDNPFYNGWKHKLNFLINMYNVKSEFKKFEKIP